jgi:hypothetical protein
LESLSPLLKEVLPAFLVEYFDLVHYTKSDTQFDIFMDEKNIAPFEYEVESKGFYPVRKVEDFPLRGKKVILHIKRRRWRKPGSTQSISRDWQLLAKGTRMTKDFADFLKEISR